MRQTAPFFAAILFLVAAGAFAAAPFGDTMIAPQRPTIDLATVDAADPFMGLPSYSTGHARQIVRGATWSGQNDYTATTTLAWTDSQFGIRIEVLDDAIVGGALGDRIELRLASRTAGPAHRDGPPVRLAVTLAADGASASVSVSSDDASVAATIGQVQTRVIPVAGGYTLYLIFPVENWDGQPNLVRKMGLQAIFMDRDTPAASADDPAENEFVLHPSTALGLGKRDTVAQVEFVTDRWLSVRPLNSLYRVGDAQFVMDYGNNTKFEQTLAIAFTDYKTGNVVKEIPSVLTVKPHSVESHVPLQIDVSDLAPGAYRLKSTLGDVTADATERYVGVSENGVLYDPLAIERRTPSAKRIEPRRAIATDDPRKVRQTLSVLAGAGEVAWSVGAYDATSFEFPELLLPGGPRVVNVPAAKEDDLAWALFAKNEELGAMNRPLLLRLDESLFVDPDDLRPNTPSWGQYEDDPVLRKVDREAKRLFMLGLVMTYTGQDAVPRIQILADGEPLTDQVLNPGADAELGARYAYVLRLWLTGKPETLRLENIAEYGHHVEIDFMAVLRPGGDEFPGAREPQLVFQGHQSANMFTKTLNTDLYLMRHYLVDAWGGAYVSMPGGRYKGVDPVATAMLLNELSAWGANQEARALARGYKRAASDMRGPPTGYDITKPLALMGLYNVWNMSNRESAITDSLWGIIRDPIDELVRDVQTHPLGLVNIRGRFGISEAEAGGATFPGVMATLGALRGAADMARSRRETELADQWSDVADRLERAWRRNLMTSATSMRVDTSDSFPASGRLPAVRGISSQIPEYAFIYGRYDTGSPVIYTGGYRVFDTPQIFAGLAFSGDVLGYSGDAEIYQASVQSARFVFNDCPLLKDPLYTQHGVIDYMSTELQAWAIRGALMSDQDKLAAGLLNAYVRYSYDELILSAGASAELSPWTTEERFQVADNGYNLGPIGDDLNVYNGCAALSLGRFICGVDDSDFSELNFATRLPEGWTRAAARNWRISHDAVGGATATIDYSYESFPDYRYSVKLEADTRLKSCTVRIGPFLPRHAQVKVTTDDGSAVVETARIGERRYAILTYTNLSRLNISVQVQR